MTEQQSYPARYVCERGAGGFKGGPFTLDLPDEGDYDVSIHPSTASGDIAISAHYESDDLTQWVYGKMSPERARDFAQDLMDAADHLEGVND